MKLPAPRYQVTDPGTKHKYHIEMPHGQVIGPLKSVTSVLGIINKPALVGWAARESSNYFKTEILKLGRNALVVETLEQIAKDASNAHRRKAGAAADLGSVCHDICEAIILGKEPDTIPAELNEAVRAFKAWRLSTDIEIVATELATGSAEHGYGGRLDAIGWSESRGGFGVIDLKTSKSLLYGNEYSFQVGGYALAMMEQYGVEFKWAEIVRLGKAAPFTSEARPVTDMRAAIDGFMAALALFKSEGTRLIGEPNFTTEPLEEKPLSKDVPVKKTRAKSAVGF